MIDPTVVTRLTVIAVSVVLVYASGGQTALDRLWSMIGEHGGSADDRAGDRGTDRGTDDGRETTRAEPSQSAAHTTGEAGLRDTGEHRIVAVSVTLETDPDE